jgi:zinc/manganese transport system substrate-binding protein/manganese/iron transport system substrate-binding protein
MILGITITAAVMVFGCGDEGGEQDPAALRAVTSLEVLADMVRNVGGGRVATEALLPSGADPHTFELSPGAVRGVAEADVVFMNGLGLEESIEDVVTNNAAGPVIELTDGLDVIAGDDEESDGHAEGDDEHADGNPHMWLDVTLAARYVERIRDALIELDPDRAADYEANATTYLAELEELDREIKEAVETIPAARRKLITMHDAFPYFAARYGLELVAVAVPSPGQEPSAQAIADLTRTIEAEGVPAVFAEPQFSSSILDEAASDAGAQVLTLLSDAYVESVDSYLALMRYNKEQLVIGLGDA